MRSQGSLVTKGSRVRKGSLVQNGMLVLASVVGAVVLTVIADRLVGAVLDPSTGLVFPPHTVVRYATPEFDVEARTNRWGFRGGEPETRRPGRLRVVALGDSFTFGWGVDLEDTWPSVLEAELRAEGMDVEVLNLGQPGADPARYAEIARQALPPLRPDLVVVAINQGDDLAQIMGSLAAAAVQPAGGGGAGDRAEATAPSLAVRLKSILKATYPNLVAVRASALAGAPMEFDVTGTWRDQTAELRSGLSEEEEERLRALDDEITGMFQRGELNPSMLAAGLRRPDEIRTTLALESEEVVRALRVISEHLRAIRASAEEGGGQVVVASLPNGFFVSETMLASYGRMGFHVDPDDLTTAAMDDATRRSASMAGVEVVTVTERFREQAASRRLFFEFDGHYTAEGQRLFATSIMGFVREALLERARRGS